MRSMEAKSIRTFVILHLFQTTSLVQMAKVCGEYESVLILVVFPSDKKHLMEFVDLFLLSPQ